MRTSKISLVVLALILQGGILWGQPRDHRMGGPPGPRQLETLRIWKMTEYLDISEGQAARFFPALQSHQEKMRQLDSAETALQHALSQDLQNSQVDQEYLDNQRREMLDIRQQRMREEQRWLESLPQYLSPEQQAKYLVFERRFLRMLREAMMRRERVGRPN